MNRRVLVTGAAGHLGSAVLGALAERGVRGIAGIADPIGRRDDSDTIAIPPKGAIDPARLAGIDTIVNCAGQARGDPATITLANVDCPIELARRARAVGVRRFVQVSSFSVYGRVETIDRDTPLRPDGDYGRSKLAAEDGLADLACAGFETVSVRLPFAFSASEPDLLGRLVSLMLRLRALPVTAGRPSARSMVTHAAAAGLLADLAQSQGAVPDRLAAADPAPLELVRIADAIRELLGRRIWKIPVPPAISSLLRQIAPGIVERLMGSNILSAKANAMAGGTAYPVDAELLAYLRRLSPPTGPSTAPMPRD